MTRNSTLIAFAALSSLLLGLVLGRGSADSTARARSSGRDNPMAVPTVAVPTATDGSLGRRLVRLQESIDALTLALAPFLEGIERPSSSMPSERRPLHDPSPSELAEVTASLQNVARLLSGLVASRSLPPTSPSAGVPLVPVRVDRNSAFDRLQIRAAAAEDDDHSWEMAHRDLQLRHLFWSAQQVLDVYGVPDEISNNGGAVNWSYMHELGNGASEYLSFEFVQGVVYAVEYDN